MCASQCGRHARLQDFRGHKEAAIIGKNVHGHRLSLRPAEFSRGILIAAQEAVAAKPLESPCRSAGTSAFSIARSKASAREDWKDEVKRLMSIRNAER